MPSSSSRNDDENNNNNDRQPRLDNEGEHFMTIFSYYCYDCNQGNDDDAVKDPRTGELTCRLCGSNFIEVIQDHTAKEATEWFREVVVNNKPKKRDEEQQQQPTSSTATNSSSTAATATAAAATPSDNINNNNNNNNTNNNISQDEIVQQIMQQTMNGSSGLPTTTRLVQQPDGSMAHQVVVDARSLNLGRFMNNNNDNNNNDDDEPFDPNRPPRQAIEIQQSVSGLDLMRMLSGGAGNDNNNNNMNSQAALLQQLLQSGNVQANVVEVEVGEEDEEDEESDSSSSASSSSSNDSWATASSSASNADHEEAEEHHEETNDTDETLSHREQETQEQTSRNHRPRRSRRRQNGSSSSTNTAADPISELLRSQGIDLDNINMLSNGIDLGNGTTAMIGVGGGNAYTQRLLRRSGILGGNVAAREHRQRRRQSRGQADVQHEQAEQQVEQQVEQEPDENNTTTSNNTSSTSTSTHQQTQTQTQTANISSNSTNTRRSNNNNNNNGGGGRGARRSIGSILRRLTSMASGINIGNLPSEADQLHRLFMDALGQDRDTHTAEIVLESLPRMDPDEARRRYRDIEKENQKRSDEREKSSRGVSPLVENDDDDENQNQNQNQKEDDICCPVCLDEYHVASEEENASRNNNFDPDFGYSQQPLPPEQIVELPCNHLFHERCALPWLRRHHSCPICRAALATDEDLN